MTKLIKQTGTMVFIQTSKATHWLFPQPKELTINMSQNKTSTQWVKDYTFVSTNENNQSFVMDSPAKKGGEKIGPSPMEAVLTMAC